MVRGVTDAQRKRNRNRLYREANREEYMECNRVYNERHMETKATNRASFFRKNPDYAKKYYRRKVEATCRSVRTTRGRPRKSETETETGSCDLKVRLNAAGQSRPMG
jgi:hypothetical protein